VAARLLKRLVIEAEEVDTCATGDGWTDCWKRDVCSHLQNIFHAELFESDA
jgi:hypothetical protein